MARPSGVIGASETLHVWTYSFCFLRNINSSSYIYLNLSSCLPLLVEADDLQGMVCTWIWNMHTHHAVGFDSAAYTARMSVWDLVFRHSILVPSEVKHRTAFHVAGAKSGISMTGRC